MEQPTPVGSLVPDPVVNAVAASMTCCFGPRRSRLRARANNTVLPLTSPDAARVDIGATEIFVALPADRATENL